MKINAELSQALREKTLWRLNQSAREVASTVTLVVKAVRRGKASYRRRMVTVPAWAMNEQHVANFCGKIKVQCGGDFAAYYLAHELAHIMAPGDNHGPKFMAALKQICPPELQHFETYYKPRAAKAAGIREE